MQLGLSTRTPMSAASDWLLSTGDIGWSKQTLLQDKLGGIQFFWGDLHVGWHQYGDNPRNVFPDPLRCRHTIWRKGSFLKELYNVEAMPFGRHQEDWVYWYKGICGRHRYSRWRNVQGYRLLSGGFAPMQGLHIPLMSPVLRSIFQIS